MWLDDFISFLSPKAGAERRAYRMALEEMKGYDAGNGGRLNSGWRVFGQSAEMTDRYSRDTVRNRARDLERNSDIANSVINAYKRNIIGAGYVLRSKTDDPELNQKIQKQWAKWCKAKNCDITSSQSFMSMMGMAVVRKKVDGGILFKKCYTSGGITPFKLQAIEVDEIDSTAIGPLHDKTNKIVGGIEYNSYNKIVGFWIKQYDIDGWATNQPFYVPAKDMIFMYSKKRPSQIREMSDMAPVITRIRDANEYMTAVSVKERITACLSVFIKKQLPTSTGRVNSAVGNPSDYAGKKLAPGMIQELNAGDEVQVVNPSGTSTDAAQMIKLHQRMIGAGQGLSYEATSRDMSQSNYSSARQGNIEDALTYLEDKQLLIETIFDEVYESFVISAVLSGLIDIADFWTNKEKYLEHEWVAAPKPWIDPQKEANANSTAITKGIKSFQDICAENGKDWKEQIDDMAQAIEYADNKGINLGEIIYGTKDETKETTTNGE